MSIKKSLLLVSITLLSVLVSSILIWQGLNLDRNNPFAQNLEPSPQVLGESQPQPLEASTSASPKKYLVTKVIDGDTFEFKSENQLFKVRLIGIDTPETVDPRRPVGCFGKNASNETKRLIEGKEVILTKDISETDKYNRGLRYVFLPLSGGENLFINDYLIRQGFANASSYPPDVKYNERFSQAEKEARDNLRGLWAECK